MTGLRLLQLWGLADDLGNRIEPARIGDRDVAEQIDQLRQRLDQLSVARSSTVAHRSGQRGRSSTNRLFEKVADVVASAHRKTVAAIRCSRQYPAGVTDHRPTN